MRIALLDEYGAFLTRAQPAAELSARALRETTRDVVIFDFDGIVQMSPSFANVLFFNLLHHLGPDEMRRCIQVENAAAHILDAINTAIRRKLERHVELSSYVPRE